MTRRCHASANCHRIVVEVHIVGSLTAGTNVTQVSWAMPSLHLELQWQILGRCSCKYSCSVSVCGRAAVADIVDIAWV